MMPSIIYENDWMADIELYNYPNMPEAISSS